MYRKVEYWQVLDVESNKDRCEHLVYFQWGIQLDRSRSSWIEVDGVRRKIERCVEPKIILYDNVGVRCVAGVLVSDVMI